MAFMKNVNIFSSALVIGVVAFGLSVVGGLAGRRLGCLFQKRAELVEHGDVDFAMNLPEGDTSDPYPQTTVLLLNQRAESLENESLRRALSLVIDRSALVEGLSCDAAEGIVPPGLRNTMGGDFRTESGSLVDNAPDNY